MAASCWTFVPLLSSFLLPFYSLCIRSVYNISFLIIIGKLRSECFELVSVIASGASYYIGGSIGVQTHASGETGGNCLGRFTPLYSVWCRPGVHWWSIHMASQVVWIGQLSGASFDLSHSDLVHYRCYKRKSFSCHFHTI